MKFAGVQPLDEKRSENRGILFSTILHREVGHKNCCEHMNILAMLLCFVLQENPIGYNGQGIHEIILRERITMLEKKNAMLEEMNANLQKKVNRTHCKV